MSIGKNALNLYAIQGANIIIPLLSLPYLGRALGPSGFGTIALAQLILQYVILMTDFGFNLTATRRISNARDNHAEISQILADTSAVRLILASIGICLAELFVLIIPSFRQAQQVVAISFLSVIGSVLTPAWLFHGTEKNRTLAAITILPRLACLIPTAALISKPEDLILAAYLQFVPLLITGILSTIWLAFFSPFSAKRPNPTGVVYAAKDGFHIFASTILTSIYAYANGIILQLTSGSVAVGIYSASEKLVKAVNSMVNPAIQAIYPRVCRGESTRLKPLYISIFMLTLSAWIVALVLGTQLTSIIFGPKFTESGELLKIFSIAPIFSSMAAISVQLKIIVWGEHPRLKFIYGSSVIFHAIQAPILISIYGPFGAACSVVLTEALTFSAVTYTTRQLEKHRVEART